MKRREALRRYLTVAGAAISAPIYLSLLEGCAPSRSPNWISKVLAKEEVYNLEALSQMIFPGGTALSAADVAVAECVDLLLTDCRSQQDQANVKSALADLEGAAIEEHNRSFHQLPPDSRREVLKAHETATYGKPGNSQQAYVALKGLILLAYYTSEQVMKTQLDYNPLAGRHDACIELSESGRVFVDNNV